MVTDLCKSLTTQDVGAATASSESGTCRVVDLSKEEEILETIYEETTGDQMVYVGQPAGAAEEIVADTVVIENCSCSNNLGLNDSTVIYGSTKTYLYKLNNDTMYRPAYAVEINLLDRAFEFLETDHEKAKNLVNAFLSLFLRPREERKRRSFKARRIEKVLSNKKLKRQKYARFQKLYKRNRKSAFESLYCKNSISDELGSEECLASGNIY